MKLLFIMLKQSKRAEIMFCESFDHATLKFICYILKKKYYETAATAYVAVYYDKTA